MKSSAFANDLVLLLFNNTSIAQIGNATGVVGSSGGGSPGSLYVALHTADPEVTAGSGTLGTQNASEAAYTGYGRVAVARSSSGWTISTNQASNTAAVIFGACTTGSSTVTHFSVGAQSSGATLILYSGPLISAFYNFTGDETANTLVAPGAYTGGILTANNQVEVIAMPNGSLPTGLVAGTIYYVASGASTDSFTLLSTSGGSTVTLSTTGSGAIGAIATLAVSAGITPQFAVAALVAALEY